MIRVALALLGLGVLCVAWLAPFHHLFPGPFSAHMSMHMAVVAVAAPLLALGLAGGRLDPVARWPALFPPVPLSILELVVVWAWHTPGLHHAARHLRAAAFAEQGSFLVCGLAVWLSAVGGPAHAGRGRRALGVVALLLTSIHITLLGALLALPPRPLYAHPGHPPSLSDQHLGGAIMLAVGGLVYLAGGVAVARTLTIPQRSFP